MINNYIIYLKLTDSPASRLYDLPNIQKDGVLTHPVASYVSSLWNNLNKYIADIMKANV